MAETRSLEARAPAERPLSPHLQIYRPMLTMMMSIVHRITGFGLYFGTLLLAWWLIAAAEPQRLCAIRMVRRLLDRPPHPVRLHLGADPSHARRHPPSDLGYRPRLRAERARMAGRRQPDRLDRDHADPVDRRLCSPWEARDERAPKHIRTPLARVRGRGAAQIRHRAFLASAAHRGRQYSADHRGGRSS